MSVRTLVAHLLPGDGDDVIAECRQCGATVDPGTDECPECGSGEIGSYNVAE